MYILYLFALVSCLTLKLGNGEGVCGDGWDLFHDEYYEVCYKYFHEGLGDYQTVVTACRGEMDSTLATINSQTEQDFLNTLIVKYKIIDDLWLDATIKNKHIVWADDSSAEYENWLPGRPVNESYCVEMLPEQEHIGKWQDVDCAKKNSYLCKRVVPWSDQRTERLVRDNRRLLEEYIAKTVKLEQGLTDEGRILTESVTRITELEDSHIPIGFIYVQLPDQDSPNSLWPKYTWSDVTSSYAGQFFRAEGGDSLGFGQGEQSYNAPRLTDINYERDGGWYSGITITPGEWTNRLLTGGWTGDSCAISLLQSSGEVRPVNQAVRIFKRTA